MNFLGLKLDVTISEEWWDGGSHYDPETRTIQLIAGPIAALVKKTTGRGTRWLMGHELTHAFLHQYPSVRKDLVKVFGDLSEKAYSGNPWVEIWGHLYGYDSEEYISPRSTLCPEEDLAEIGAYLYCGNSMRGLSRRVQDKIRAFKAAIKKAKTPR